MRAVSLARRSDRWLRFVTLVAILVALLPLPTPVAAAPVVAAAPFTLTLSASGGVVTASPPGPVYAAGTVVTLTATPVPGNVLIKWAIDGVADGWQNPRTITMDADHAVAATFVPRPTFSDVPPDAANHGYITELAARGIIKGYSPDECAARGLAYPCFGPGDPIVRAQVAALIVRSFGWDNTNPSGPAPFSDLDGVDPELQRAIAILAQRGIINGYGDGTFGPTDRVLHIQVVSFLTRAMVQAGHWQAVTQDDPRPYPNVPLASGHRLDLLTFLANAGPIADRPANQPWADWDTLASRGWTAQGLWQGLDSFFGPAGPGGGPSPSPRTSPVPGNQAPVAVADSYATAEDTALTVATPGVLGNDSDPEGNALTAVTVTGPTHGTVLLNASGAFTYTPAANYNGPDSFTYQARDTSGALSAVTTVTISVSATNDAPVNTAPSSQNIAANTPLPFSTANGNPIRIADVDAGSAPVQVALVATNGTVSLSGIAGLTFTVGDGTGDVAMTFTGTLAAINAALDGLTFVPATGYIGTASLQITTNDQGNSGAGGPLTDSDTVTIAVAVGAAATIAKAGESGSTIVAGVRTLQALVTDATGVPVPGYAVAWAVASGGGSLSGTSSLTNASGIASIDWTLGTTAGAQSATASATGLAGSPLTFTVTATPADASGATSTIVAAPTSIVADGVQTAAITVQLQDQYGNNLGTGGTTVVLTTTAGTLTGTTGPATSVTATDNNNGTYSATLRAPTVAGTATISGTVNTLAITDTAAVTLTAGAATTIVKVAGDNVTTTVGTTVTPAPSVQVVDANNNPVAGITVTFAVASGGGTLTGGSQSTDANGTATVGSWTLGTVAGPNTLTASATGLSTVTFTATGTAASGAALSITTQPSASAQSGVAFVQQPVIQLRDAFGNPTPTAGAAVTAAVASGSGTLGGLVTVNTDAAGVATFTNLAISGTVGSYTLSFSSSGVTGATSNAITLTAGAANKLAITTQPSATAQGGTAFAQQPVIQVQDAAGNAVAQAGVAVTAAIASGGGTLTGTTTVNTNASGVATFTDLAITGTAGPRTIAFSATAAGLAGVTSGTVTLVVGPAARLTITTPTSSVAQAGIAFPQQPTIQVQDASGNPVAQAGISVTAAIASGGGSLLGTTTVTTLADGSATFTDLAIGGVVGDRTLSFAATGLTGATSGTITVGAGNAAALTFGVQPSNVVASAPITPAVQVRIEDAYGNLVTTATSAVTVAIGTNPSGGALSGTVTVAASGGIATFSGLSINLTGTGYTLTASSGALTGATSAPFNVIAGPLDHFLVEAAGGGPIGSQLAGTPFTVRVTAQDAYNNTATTFTGTVTFSSNPAGGISAGTLSASFTNGVLSSHSITFGTAGSFTLTATRTGGTESGTSTSFDVQAAPTAVADAPVPNSAPGQAFHAFYSTSATPQTFTLGAPGVLSNDTLGFPLATITSFGAGSLGGAVTTYAAGSTVSPLPTYTTGLLTVGANGAISFTPPDGFTGNYTFSYRLANARGTSDAQVTIAVGARPSAASDTYNPVLLGNVPINTATSTQFSVATNDTGDGKTFTVGTQTNGTATIAPTGTFTFRPTPGYEGAASFTYTVTNGFGTSTPATVSLTVVTPIWFINASVGAGGDGRYDAPFNSLGSFATINNGTGNNPAANERIFLYSGAYTGPVTLLNGQYLIGQGTTASLSSVASVTWPADAGPEPTMNGTSPTITAAGATAVTLNSAGGTNTLRGFNLGNVGAGGTALAGATFGTLTIAEVGINSDGRALNLASGTLAGDIPTLISTGGANNVVLANVATGGATRTLGSAGQALSGATGDAVSISGGNGAFTFAGTISNTATLAVNVANKTGGTVTFEGNINPSAAGRGIAVTSNSGGTVTFSGAQKRISTGTSAGVTLSNNSGATITFSGGGLAITTTTGNGFNAAGGGTAIVTGSANTIGSTGGVALNVSSTIIGSGGLNFQSIAANGGANGIILSNTGSTAGLMVTGAGTADSGGVIQNMTGDGIALTNTSVPTFTAMRIQSSLGSGIKASGVSDLVLSAVIVRNNGDSTGGTEAGILLVNLSGTSQITNSTVDGSFEDNIRWTPSSGSQTLNITGSTVGPNNATSGNSGLNIIGTGTANATLNVTSSTFKQNKSFGIGTSFTDNSAHTINVSSSTFTDNNSAIGLGTTVNADLTFDIHDNPTILRSTANAIQILAGTSSTTSSLIRGKIRNNTIGDSSVDSGTRDGIGIAVEINENADAVVEVTNNTIRHTDQDGIFIQSRLGSAATDFIVTGNSVGQPDDNSTYPYFFVYGIRIEARQTTNVCARISANTASGVGGATGIQVRQRNTATFRLEGLTGAANNAANVATYVSAQNNGVAAEATLDTTFTSVASGSCRTAP